MTLAFPKPLPKEPEPKVAKKSERTKRHEAALAAWGQGVKARAGGICEMAQEPGHVCHGPVDPAHVIGRGRCPRLALDPENGVALCRKYHDLFDRTRWFRPHFWAFFDAKYPGRRARLFAKAAREGRLA